MHNLVYAFMHFHYDLNKVTLDYMIKDIYENAYFDEALEAQVIETLKEVYQEWLDNV